MSETDILMNRIAELEEDLKDERNDSIQDGLWIKNLQESITELKRGFEQVNLVTQKRLYLLKEALVNCRMEREYPTVVYFIVNQALLRDPFHPEGS